MGNPLYRHRYINMGIPYHNITSGKCIHIKTYRPIINIRIFGIHVSTLSFTEGRGIDRLLQLTGYLKIIITEPSVLLKHKTCGRT